MYYVNIVVATVDVLSRMRSISEDKVSELVKSIREVGMISPITLHSPNEETLDLVAGAHRLAAIRRLGWETVDAFIIDDLDDLKTQLIEIDENLCRHELTATQQAEHLQRRKEIWEAMRERDRVSDQVEQKPQGGRPTEF